MSRNPDYGKLQFRVPVSGSGRVVITHEELQDIHDRATCERLGEEGEYVWHDSPTGTYNKWQRGYCSHGANKKTKVVSREELEQLLSTKQVNPANVQVVRKEKRVRVKKGGREYTKRKRRTLKEVESLTSSPIRGPIKSKGQEEVNVTKTFPLVSPFPYRPPTTAAARTEPIKSIIPGARPSLPVSPRKEFVYSPAAAATEAPKRELISRKKMTGPGPKREPGSRPISSQTSGASTPKPLDYPSKTGLGGASTVQPQVSTPFSKPEPPLASTAPRTPLGVAAFYDAYDDSYDNPHDEYDDFYYYDQDY